MFETEQIEFDGNICYALDQKLSRKEIDSLYKKLFFGNVEKKGKEHVVFKNVGLLTCNVTYLGSPHPLYKKRIQLKKYFPEVKRDNDNCNIKTLYVGIYTYLKTRLFVVFEPFTYFSKKSHNSSAHIFTANLQYAQRTGEFFKIDSFGNSVYVFKEKEFINFIKIKAGILSKKSIYNSIMTLIKNYMEKFFDDMPKLRKGVDAYKEMLDANYKNAKQNRWRGWYFEYLFKKYLNLNNITEIQMNANKSKNGIDLDLFFPNLNYSYGDLKVDQINEDILGNAFDSFDKVININNGVVYYVCALCESEKDSDHNYVVTEYWNTIRDKEKVCVDDEYLKSRTGKYMKFSCKIKKIYILKIDKDVYNIIKKNPFKQGLNSDGKVRKPKLKIKKDMLNALSIYTYDCEERITNEKI